MNSVVVGILQNQYTLHTAVRINLMFAVVPRNLNFTALVLQFVPSRRKKNIIVRINGTGGNPYPWLHLSAVYRCPKNIWKIKEIKGS